MPRALTVRQICERALRKVGVYSIADQGADYAQMEEARYWLDMVIGHVASRQRSWWLIGDAIEQPLAAEQVEYELNNISTGDNQNRSPQFVVSASLRDSNGEDTPIDLLRRWEYDAITDKDREGKPECVYVQRLKSPTLFVHPVPDTDDYTLLLTVQRYATDLTRDATANSEFTFQLREAWNLFIVTALAYEIGSGPVTTLPDGELQRLDQRQERLLRQLEEYENQEHADEPRIAAYNDF